MSKKRIVITGMGVVSPLGIGKEEFYHSLREGKSGVRPITVFDTSKYKVKLAGEVPNFDPQAILGKKGLLDLDRATKLLLSSAKLALDDSELKVDEHNGPTIGVSVGTTLGSLSSISKFNHESFIDGPKLANPSIFPNTVVNSPASRIGIKFKITGFNSTISTGMCSAVDALDYACDFIDLNRVKTVFVGAVEDLSVPSFLGCYKLNYLSGLDESSPVSRPFDKKRNGIIFAEGATVLIIEDLETALQRKAKIYAEVLSISSCFEPGHYYKHSPGGQGMARSMKMSLEQAHLKPQDIDCVFANANSTKDADKIEAKAIKDVFGAAHKDILVTSIKSYLGEGFSVSGGFSLIAAVESLRHNCVVSLLNYENRDPECDLNFATVRNSDVTISRAMVNTFNSNGAASVAILGTYDNRN